MLVVSVLGGRRLKWLKLPTKASLYSFPERQRYNVDFENQYKYLPLQGGWIMTSDLTRHVKHIKKYLKDQAQWYEDGQTILVSWRAREEDWTEWWGQKFVLLGRNWMTVGGIHETSWKLQVKHRAYKLVR